MAAVPLNYKGMLITFCMKNAKPSPTFQTLNSGPPHNTVFTCTVSIGDQFIARAEDKTKKSAENKAAKGALEILENLNIPKSEINSNYVALLNHFCQSHKCSYNFVECYRHGPPHDLEFRYRANVREREFSESSIKKNVKQAKQEAAYIALKELRNEFPDDIQELPESFRDESGSESSSRSESAGSRASENEISSSTPADSGLNYIAILNRVCQKQQWACNFLDIQNTGAANMFVCRVSLNDRLFPESSPRGTKKDAKKEAAFMALRALRDQFAHIIPELPRVYTDDSSVSRQNVQNGHLGATGHETTSTSSSSSINSFSNSQSPLNQFTNISRIDEGAFGKVVKAKKMLDDKEYAIKIVPLRDQKYVQEVKTLAHLEHKNIVRYYNAWWGEDCFPDSSESESGSSYSDFSGSCKACLFIQMELCENGSLKNWIKKRNKAECVDKKKSLEIFQQIIDGVKYIHDQQLIHRDLKPANILFTKQMVVKIGDFGLVTQMTGEHERQALERTKGTGTPSYMAPEQSENMYENEVDIYAVGLILVELLWIFGTGHERANEWSKIRKGVLPDKFLENYPIEVYEIKRMLSADPKQRPSAAELKTIFERKYDFHAKTR